jgi:hypothetical protein
MVTLALASPGGALASHRQAMILQDDAKLIYSSPESVSSTLQTLKNMGVDRVRVSVVWQLLAPKPGSSKKPKFDATNPNAYRPGVWARWDFLDRVATQDGLQVYLQPTARSHKGDDPTQARAGVPVVPRSQRHRLRPIRAGRRPALQRRLRMSGPDIATTRS